MKIDLEFVQLHAPLFIDGMNFGEKLYADKRNKAPIKMWYDTDLKKTIIVYKNKVTLVESTASQTLADPSQIGLAMPKEEERPLTVIRRETPAVKAQASGPERFSPQVETPHDKIQGRPGRKPKYQGEETKSE